jgi:acyl-homoserine lactone acylase PvdQ
LSEAGQLPAAHFEKYGIYPTDTTQAGGYTEEETAFNPELREARMNWTLSTYACPTCRESLPMPGDPYCLFLVQCESCGAQSWVETNDQGLIELVAVSSSPPKFSPIGDRRQRARRKSDAVPGSRSRAAAPLRDDDGHSSLADPAEFPPAPADEL